MVNRELHFPAQLSLHQNRLAQRPRYCGSRTNSSVNLPLHFPLTHEHDPEILALLHLIQELPSNLKRASHPFPVENHGLKLGGADLHPSRFTLCCELLHVRYFKQNYFQALNILRVIMAFRFAEPSRAPK
ncbi:hypothetical protein XENOCAPTIV_018531 [Xenoophorus captivus]|uniref:Uncharacterized protein n=1 Tax=Xenoophorus captivus TaxID=1517983 RepID=A0ABV0QIZ0_9TELE